MRVIHLWAQWRPGQCGVTDYTNLLVSTLRKQGVDASVLAAVPSSRVAAPNHGNMPLNLGTKWGLTSAQRAVQILRKARPDIVHVQYATRYGRGLSLLWFLMIGRLLCRGSRWVVTLHEVNRPSLFRGATRLELDRLAFRLLLQNWDAIITTNDGYAKAISTELLKKGQNLSKPHVIPLGSNIQPVKSPDISRVQANYGFSTDNLIFVYFGLFRRGKGLLNLLEAFSIVRKRVPLARLVLVGTVHPEAHAFYTHLHQVSHSLGIEPYLVWAERLPPDEISRLLSMADVCVLPFRKGFNLNSGSFAAAVVHHLPIITTRGPMSPQNFVAEESLLLVPPQDPQALANAMKTVATSRLLRERLRSNIAQFADWFDWSCIAERTISVYKSVIE